MKVIRTCMLACLALLLSASALMAQAVTREQAAQLAQQFLPKTVTERYTQADQLERIQDPLKAIQPGWGEEIYYLNFTMPDDPNQYLLLGWGNWVSTQDLYWRVLRSTDQGKSWTVQQDAPRWYGPIGYNNHWWLADLTGGGIPELCVEGGPLGRGGESLLVFAWRNGGFDCITPQDPTSLGDFGYIGAFYSNTVTIQDVDGDGKAEIIVSPSFDNEPDPNFTWQNPSYHTVVTGPTRIYKYDGTSYILWRKIPWSKNDRYPIDVPALGVVHPGTIPLSELEAQANSKKASGKGNSDLQIFVGHPAGDNSVDDMVTNTFAYQGTPLTFKKRWPNQKQPDASSANWQWEGCPVKQTKASGSGQWNPSPEDHCLPSPDGVTEFHFVGPYLEFRLPRSAVYPMLLSQATADFAKDPSRQTDYISIPISGMLKNQKYVAVNALVCVKNTAAAHSAAGEKSRVQDSEKKDSAPKK